MKWLWISIIVGIIVVIGTITIDFSPDEFKIILNDGAIKARYYKGVLTVYSGRYVAFKDEIRPFYRVGSSYKTMYKARGTKYSNLSYYRNDDIVYVKQDIYFSKGNLTRYFIITEYDIKESFEWNPTDPNLRTYFTWTYSNMDSLNEKEVYLDSTTKGTSSEMDFGIKNTWKDEIDNTVRVERFKNGNLRIRTKVFEGPASYDPKIILKEKPKKTIKTEYTYNSKLEEYDDGTGNAVISTGMVYADSKGTRIEDAPSLMTCEFCSNMKLGISVDEKYPVEVLDYNYTSIKVKLKIDDASLLSKNVDLEVYDKNNKSIKYFDSYKRINNLEDSREVTLPFGMDKEIKWGKESTIVNINATTNSGWLRDTSCQNNADVINLTPGGHYWFVGSSYEGSGLPGMEYRTFLDFNTSGIVGVDTASIYIHSTADSTNPGDVGTLYQCNYGTLTTGDWTTTLGSSEAVLLTNGMGTNAYHNSTISGGYINAAGQTQYCITSSQGCANSDDRWYNYADTSPTYLNVTYSGKRIVNITNPTTDNKMVTENGSLETFTFLMLVGGINITTGVDVTNATANGTTIPINTSSICIGTLDCSQYAAEAACDNCSQCTWTAGDIFSSRFGNGPDSDSTPTATFTTMGDTNFAGFWQGNTDNDILYAINENGKTATSLNGEIWEDGGTAEQSANMYGVIAYGSGTIDGNQYECGLESDGSTTHSINFDGDDFPDTNYAIMCTPGPDYDAPICMLQDTIGKATTGFSVYLNDDFGIGETVATVNYCAFEYGEYSTGDMYIKAGSDAVTNGAVSLDFTDEGLTDYADTNYVVFIIDITSYSADACYCEVGTRATTGFTALCSDDGGSSANCDDTFDWVTFSIIDEDITGGSCDPIDGGGCVNCSIDECDTNCSDAGCSVDNLNDVWWTEDVGWRVNVSMPSLISGYYDLNITATYSGSSSSDIKVAALNHSYVPGEAPPSDTCTCPGDGTNHVFELSDECKVSSCLADDINFSGTTGYIQCNGAWVIEDLTLNVSGMNMTVTSNCDITIQ